MPSTFYMVEMDYPDHDGPGRVSYDSFYERHIGMLLSIPGFLVAQRFECVHSAAAPFLAVYQLSGPDVMKSEEYVSRAGRMSVPEEYRKLMTNWDRNLVQSGLSDLRLTTRESRDNGTVLTLIDRSSHRSSPFPAGFASMVPVGLDRTFVERGARIGGLLKESELSGCHVRNFRPICDPREK